MLYKTIFLYRFPLNLSCPVCLVLAGSSFISKLRVLILYFFSVLKFSDLGLQFYSRLQFYRDMCRFCMVLFSCQFYSVSMHGFMNQGFQFCSYLQCNAFQGPNFIAPICFCMFFYIRALKHAQCACWRRGKHEQQHVTKHRNWMDLMGFDGFLHRASTCFKKKQKYGKKNVRFWVDLEGCNFVVPKNCLRSGAPIL